VGERLERLYCRRVFSAAGGDCDGSSWELGNSDACSGTRGGIALGTGFAWGFGAVMFGQSVSAIGIALVNAFVLAISSALARMFFGIGVLIVAIVILSKAN
jgi:hypothetical protein